MKCPYCGSLRDRVIDSRQSKDGDVIRRRRLCLDCNKRFTSYERIEESVPVVIKKDGRREPFDRMKILNGLKKACEKRPVSVETLQKIVDTIEKKAMDTGESEIMSAWIGEEVMNHLRELDKVAYVRFASVYREFRDVKEFLEEIGRLFSERKR
jgi:transcriptional repressor NrdR